MTEYHKSKDSIYRLKWVSRIENTWFRRLMLVLLSPVLLVLNCAIATVSVVAFTFWWWWNNNRQLVKMTIVRWNTRLDEQADSKKSVHQGEALP